MKNNSRSTFRTGLKIPPNVLLHTNTAGRKFYLVGASITGQTKIRYTDTGEYENLPTSKLKEEIQKEWERVSAGNATTSPRSQKEINQRKR